MELKSVTSSPEDLDYLYKLARTKTVSGRRTLIATIGDLFFSQNQVLTDRERVLMSEILRNLINDVEVSVRRALADRLAALPDAPHDLVLALANDQIEVAHPLLLRSEVLQDIELIEIIRNRTLEHQLAIAMRKSLSQQVADALVETQNVDVIKTLLENHSAQISRSTMEYLVEQSQRVDTYQNPLLRRPELDPSLAKRMYWWVSAALRRHILDHFEVDPVELDHAMEDAVSDLADAVGDAELKSTELAERLSGQGAITPALLVQALREGEVSLFVACFAKYTGIRPKLVQRLLFEDGGEGLAVACKARNIEKSVFAWIYLLSRKAHATESTPGGSDTARLMALYDRIKPSAANVLVKKWQRNPDFLKAIWQIEGIEHIESAL